MRKPALCIFLWPLYSDILSLLTSTVPGGGGGIKEALLIAFFFIFLYLKIYNVPSKILM